MADRPRGLHPAYTLHGGPPAIHHYEVSGTGNIYKGDVVSKAASGRIIQCPLSTSAIHIVGVSAAFTDSTSTATTIPVYVDLANTVFECQADASALADQTICGPGQHYDLINASLGTSVTGLSGIELDDDGSSHDHVWIIDKVDRPGNDWGSANIDLHVMFHVNAWSQASLKTT